MTSALHIRVLVSATVRHLQDEWYYLMKSASPHLALLCEARGLVWGGLDILGVGDADEESLANRFAELQHGTTYFIGLLGEQFDPSPAFISRELLERWPELADQPVSSVAEIEITFGVLKNEAMRGRGFFYFRDPNFVDDPVAGVVELASENAETVNRLRFLKKSIREAQRTGVCRLRENYSSAAELVRWIIEDVTRLADELSANRAGEAERNEAAQEVDPKLRELSEARRRFEEESRRLTEKIAEERVRKMMESACQADDISEERRRVQEQFFMDYQEARRQAADAVAPAGAADQPETEALFARTPPEGDRESAGREVPQSPQPYDDDVMFTAYRPRTVVPQKWYSLLAFAHLSERRPDAADDEPDPIAEVQRQAKQILAEAIDDYKESADESSSNVPRSGELTFKPFIEGIEFNPPTRTFRWEESVHREEFKLRAAPALDGQLARGWLTVYLGPLVLAQINLNIKVDSRHSATVERPFGGESARPLRKVFASYSHRDLAIVAEIEKAVSSAHLGVQYLRDATTLRAGEVWNEALMRMIREADMFQLFWSTNSMHSAFVREEYQYALSLGKPKFVLPVYWETPFPQKPEENLPPAELLRLHFEKLGESHAGAHPAMPGSDESEVSPMGFADEAIGSAEGDGSAAAHQDTMRWVEPGVTGGRDEPSASDAATGKLMEPAADFANRDDSTRCPNCDASVRPLARFCSRCGASMREREEEQNSGAFQAPPPMLAMEPPARTYPAPASIGERATGSLPAAPESRPPPMLEFLPDLPAAPARAPKKRSSIAIVGLVVSGLAFLLIVPIALLAISGISMGSPNVGGGELPLLLGLLFIFVLGGVLLLGGIVLLLVKRARR